MKLLIAQAGEAIYGPRWQSELARELRCNIRTIQRYAAGTHEPPPSIWQEIAEIAAQRRDALDALIPRLLAESDPGKYG